MLLKTNWITFWKIQRCGEKSLLQHETDAGSLLMLCRCSTRSYFFPPFCSLALRPLFSCSPRIIDRRLLLRMERSLCQRFIPTFEDVKVSHSRLGFLSSSSQTAPFQIIYASRSSIQTTVSYLFTVTSSLFDISSRTYQWFILRYSLFLNKRELRNNIIVDFVVSVTIVSLILTIGSMSLTTWSWMIYHGKII